MPLIKIGNLPVGGSNLTNNKTEVFGSIQDLTNRSRLWYVRCLTLSNFCIGKLIFDSTLPGHFRGSDKKRFNANLPLIKIGNLPVGGSNLTNNKTEAFGSIQDLTNRSRLWYVRCLILSNLCIGKPWSITPKERRPGHPRLQLDLFITTLLFLLYVLF